MNTVRRIINKALLFFPFVFRLLNKKQENKEKKFQCARCKTIYPISIIYQKQGTCLNCGYGLWQRIDKD